MSKAQPIVNEDVAAEKIEQENALEDAGYGTGQAQIDLGRLAAEIRQGEEQPGEQYAQRMEPAEESDDDRGKAVAGRDLRGQLPDRAGHLEQAGGAGEPAAQQQAEPDESMVAEAGISRRARRLAQDLELESHQGFS